MIKGLIALLSLCAFSLLAEPIGRVSTAEITLPYGDIKVVKMTDASPIILRLDKQQEANGLFRYHIEYSILEKGEYDLIKYLRMSDGKSQILAKPFLVKGESSLELPFKGILAIEPNQTPKISSHYGILVKVFWFSWIALLVLYLFYTRSKKVVEEEEETMARTPAIDRLLELLKDKEALKQHAHWQQIEALFFNFAITNLCLKKLEPEMQIRHIKEHPKLGEILSQLELCLHKQGAEQSDIEKLVDLIQTKLRVAL